MIARPRVFKVNGEYKTVRTSKKQKGHLRKDVPVTVPPTLPDNLVDLQWTGRRTPWREINPLHRGRRLSGLTDAPGAGITALHLTGQGTRS